MSNAFDRFDEGQAQHVDPEANPFDQFGPTIEPSKTFSGSGTVEPIMAMASGLASEIGGGIAGIAQAMNPLAEEGAGAAAVEGAKGFVYEPTTEDGKRNMKFISMLAEKGIDIMNIPISGWAGLAELALGNGMDQAADTVTGVKEEGIGKTAGSRVFEETGSPTMAAIAESAPTAIGEFLGLKGAGAAAKAMKPMAKELAVTAGPAIEGVLETAKDVANAKLPGTQKKTARMLENEIDRADYGIELGDTPGIKDPTAFQKAIGADLPSIQKDKQAVEASAQGFDEGFIDTVKKEASDADLIAMQEMTDISEKGKKNPLYEVDNQPADVAGKVLLDKINEVKRVNRKAGQNIDKVARSLANQKIDVSMIGDDFIGALDELDVRIGNDGKLNFEDSFMNTLPGSKKAVKHVFEELVKNQNPSAYDLHKIKRFIDEQITYGKSVTGLGREANQALKKLRRDIDTKLDEKFPEYNEANTVYADTVGVLDEIQRLAGKNTDLTSDSAKGSLGKLSRRLMSNAQSRGQLQDAITDIDTALKSHGNYGALNRLEGPEGSKSGPANLKMLMLYADELDKVVGTSARTSLTGSMGTALDAIDKVPVNTQSMYGAAADLVKGGAKKMRGINQQGAYRSIRELLNKKQNKKTPKPKPKGE